MRHSQRVSNKGGGRERERVGGTKVQCSETKMVKRNQAVNGQALEGQRQADNAGDRKDRRDKGRTGL